MADYFMMKIIYSVMSRGKINIKTSQELHNYALECKLTTNFA